MSKAKVLDYINYFRAIAIIFIVAGHTLCWGHSTMLEFNKLLFAGGTYFFVFIAGFLFQYLSENFNVKIYFKKKLLNVICPFLITLLPVALLYTYQNVDNWAFQHATIEMRFFSVLMGGYILNGPVWFIGMIFIMFLASPLFLWARKNLKIYLGLFLATFILCFIFPRESSVNMFIGFNPYESSFLDIFYMNLVFYFKSFLHFAFIYILGMEVSYQIKNNLDFIKNNLKSIFQISLFLYVFHFIVHLFIVKTSVNQELISKLIETFVLLSGVMLIEEKIKNNKMLDNILNVFAQYSFGIFFIHGYLINLCYFHSLYTQRNCETFLNLSANSIYSCLIAFSMFLTVLFGSLFILFVIKKVLKILKIKNTRFFIGV